MSSMDWQNTNSRSSPTGNTTTRAFPPLPHRPLDVGLTASSPGAANEGDAQVFTGNHDKPVTEVPTATLWDNEHDASNSITDNTTSKAVVLVGPSKRPFLVPKARMCVSSSLFRERLQQQQSSNPGDGSYKNSGKLPKFRLHFEAAFPHTFSASASKDVNVSTRSAPAPVEVNVSVAPAAMDVDVSSSSIVHPPKEAAAPSPLAPKETKVSTLSAPDSMDLDEPSPSAAAAAAAAANKTWPAYTSAAAAIATLATPRFDTTITATPPAPILAGSTSDDTEKLFEAYSSWLYERRRETTTLSQPSSSIMGVLITVPDPDAPAVYRWYREAGLYHLGSYLDDANFQNRVLDDFVDWIEGRWKMQWECFEEVVGYMLSVYRHDQAKAAECKLVRCAIRLYIMMLKKGKGRFKFACETVGQGLRVIMGGDLEKVNLIRSSKGQLKVEKSEYHV
ncbi:MAG: hypothetical protein M1831_003865 [Alyxoria varia]|nr:MAG: hypothetical protein M1831_003865 [Alyxoria varia]